MSAGDTAHSHQWQGPTSRGLRTSRKLGQRVTLARLEELLKRPPAEPDDDETERPAS